MEIIFRKRGQTTQEIIGTWLTHRTPEKNWKDTYKSRSEMLIKQLEDLGIP